MPMDNPPPTGRSEIFHEPPEKVDTRYSTVVAQDVEQDQDGDDVDGEGGQTSGKAGVVALEAQIPVGLHD